MNAQIQQILASRGNKTQKIKDLWALGIRDYSHIAELTQATYGTVWVVINRRSDGSSGRQAGFLIDSLLRRKFGVEIEAYGIERDRLVAAIKEAGLGCSSGIRSAKNADWWKVTGDNSVEGENAFEIVSPILEGEAGLKSLQTVCQVLVSLKAKINKSCGLNIHFDAREFNLSTWKRLFKNWINYQNIIDGMLPPSRRENRYCRNLLNGSNITAMFNRIDAARSLIEFIRIWSDRYFVINTKSYAIHGTVEFRQHSGTVEFEKIEKWIRLLDGLVKFSQTELSQANTLESMALFLEPNIVNYIHHRTNHLNA